MSKQTEHRKPSAPTLPATQILRNPDGTLTLIRPQDPQSPPQSDPTLPIPVLTKDLTINPSNHTSLRLFLPRKPTLPYNNNNNNTKLPLIVFFHGGAFIRLRPASTMFHDFCVELADGAAAVVASVDYRLAPEHRLPAAYDDAVEALHWIKNSEYEWLTKYIDYSGCYLMGNSAGATIAYHAGLRVAAEGVGGNLEPLKIQGLILRQPYFGGSKRSESELRLKNDPFIPLSRTDLMWELALPVGADRDHEYCNPAAVDGGRVEKMRDAGWRVLVSGNGEDPLVDRAKELVKLLEEKAVSVVSDFEDHGSHIVEYGDPDRAKRLIDLVKAFIYFSAPN